MGTTYIAQRNRARCDIPEYNHHTHQQCPMQESESLRNRHRIMLNDEVSILAKLKENRGFLRRTICRKYCVGECISSDHLPLSGNEQTNSSNEAKVTHKKRLREDPTEVH